MEHDDENRANRPRKSTTFLTLHKRQADLLGNTNGMSRHGKNKLYRLEQIFCYLCGVTLCVWQKGTHLFLP